MTSGSECWPRWTGCAGRSPPDAEHYGTGTALAMSLSGHLTPERQDISPKPLLSKIRGFPEMLSGFTEHLQPLVCTWSAAEGVHCRMCPTGCVRQRFPSEV